MHIYGDHDLATVAQLAKITEVAYDTALMADGHVGYVMPTGGVAAYDNKVCPIGVGVDIACGNKAVRTNVPATGVRGFIGGSMGGASVIVDAQPYDRNTLASTVHGSGRVMGRNEARGKWKQGKCVKPGLISPEEMREAVGDVILRGGDLDEAPQAYRSLPEVLARMGHIEYVQHVLQPLIVCMAPSRTGATR